MTGERGWQQVMGEMARHWMCVAAAADRVPANLDAVLAAEPNVAVLVAVGLTVIATFDFPTQHACVGVRRAHQVHELDVISVLRTVWADTLTRESDLRDRLLGVSPPSASSRTTCASPTSSLPAP